MRTPGRLRGGTAKKEGPSHYLVRAALKVWGVSRVSSALSQRNQRHRKSKRGAYVHRRWYVRTAAKYFLQEC